MESVALNLTQEKMKTGEISPVIFSYVVRRAPLHTHKEFIISLQVYLFTGNLIVLKHERRLDFLDSLKLCYFVYLWFAFWNKNKLFKFSFGNCN